MKLPRDLTGQKLAKSLETLGYAIELYLDPNPIELKSVAILREVSVG